MLTFALAWGMREKMKIALPCFLLGAWGCAPRPLPSMATAVLPAAQAVQSKNGRLLPFAPSLRVEVHGPSQSPYVAESFGALTRTVVLSVTNDSDERKPLPRLWAHYTALREGIPFRCSPSQAGIVKGSEPSALEPHQTFSIERELACLTPLPGAYQVEVRVSAGKEPAAFEDAERVGSFVLRVLDSPAAPRPIAALSGVFVGMGGARVTRPLSRAGWQAGDYRVLVIVVNAGRRAQPLGRITLSFETTKQGAGLPCAGESEPLKLPAELAPGAVEFLRIPVTCAPSEPGKYEIAGRLLLESGFAASVGSIHVEVSENPMLFSPEPWPYFGQGAGAPRR